jgi:hypothetical protein
VVAPVPSPEHLARWRESFDAAEVMFLEADVTVSYRHARPINNDHEDDAA